MQFPIRIPFWPIFINPVSSIQKHSGASPPFLFRPHLTCFESLVVVVILFYLAKTTGRCAYFKDSQGKQHMEEIMEDPRRGKKQREREGHKETKRGRKATKLDHNYKLDIRDTIKQKRHIWLHSITGKDKTLKMRKIQ